jgi:hypothetical protein
MSLMRQNDEMDGEPSRLRAAVFLGCSEVSIHGRSVVAGLLAATLVFYLKGGKASLRTIGSCGFHLKSERTKPVVRKCGTARSGPN